MLIGYVSDEDYVALQRCCRRVRARWQDGGGRTLHSFRRSVRGVEAGTYRVALGQRGFGSKRVHVEVQPVKPYQFRLLSDRLLGYIWPKWVRSGERAEFRVHSPSSRIGSASGAMD